MAAANGQTQDTQVKKGIAPQQRNLFIGLGAAGLLALVGAGLFFSGAFGGGGSEATPVVVANAAPGSAPGTPGAVPVDLGAGAAGAAPGIDPATGAAPAAATTATSTVAQPLQRFRPDPFQQAYFIPTPVPTLPPEPVFTIPQPSDIEPIFIPGVPGGNAELQKPLNLPPVRISRLDESLRRPSGAFPPRRTLGGAGGGGGGVPEQSYDKRLSGVVISDGVRAILEIQGPAGRVSRIVQPGDEVDGITVLNIQRFNDGARTVTRMLIRENGEERIVELRPGVPVGPPPGAGGEGGVGPDGGLGAQPLG